VIVGFGFVTAYLRGLATGGRLQQAGGTLAGRDLVDFRQPLSRERTQRHEAGAPAYIAGIAIGS
jgi:hypothetical protein